MTCAPAHLLASFWNSIIVPVSLPNQVNDSKLHSTEKGEKRGMTESDKLVVFFNGNIVLIYAIFILSKQVLRKLLCFYDACK